MISRLRSGDEPVLQELCRRFKERVPSEAEAARLLARDDVHVLVALESGELAGFAYCHVLLRIDGDTSVFLYELGVDENFRGRGFGHALVEECRALAERVDAVKMWVQTEPDNLAAHRTYESAGGVRRPGVDILYSWRLR